LFNVVAGLGPGGLREITNERIHVGKQCVPGSSHGGKGDREESPPFKTGSVYDQENITSLLGGSGGETVSLLLKIFRC